jgi:hypothetical protein
MGEEYPEFLFSIPKTEAAYVYAASADYIQCGYRWDPNYKYLAEACGSRNYLELILQVLTRKALDGIGTT